MRSPLKRAIEVPAGVCCCELPEEIREGTAGEDVSKCDLLDLAKPQLLQVLRDRFSGGLAAAQATAGQLVNRLNAQRSARNITQSLAASAAQHTTTPKKDNTGMSYTYQDLEARAVKSERKARRATARADAAHASGDPTAIAKRVAKAEKAERKAYQRRTAAVRARHADTLAGRLPNTGLPTCDPSDTASRATATAQPSDTRAMTGSGAWEDKVDDLGAAAIATAARAAAMLAAGGSGLRRGPNGEAIRAADLARADATHADALDCETGAAARLASRSRNAILTGTRLGMSAAQARASLAADGAPHRAAGATAVLDAVDDEDTARQRMIDRGRAAASTPNPKGSRKS